MTTETPRTDALIEYLRPRENYMISDNGDWSKLCRQLERELNEERKVLKRYRDALMKIATAELPKDTAKWALYEGPTTLACVG